MIKQIPDVKKIFCIGDVHLFRNKRFHEHKYVFENLYRQCEEEKPDLIILTGDIIDSKLNISTEQVILLREFLSKLLSFCPVIQILGNHDLNLNNKDRWNLIEETANSFKEKSLYPLYFYKHSGVYENFHINFAVWSCLDDQMSPFKINDKNDELYTIGLYHGSVKGCVGENGFRLTEGIEVSEFDGTDITIMSDIHTQQSFRNNEVVYTGSLIQTKSNENAEGSFLQLDWNYIENKFDIHVKKVENKFSILIHRISDINVIEDNVFGNSIPKEKLLRIEYDRNIISKSQAIDYKKQIQLQYPNNKVLLIPITKSKKNVVLGEEDNKDLNESTDKLDLNFYIKDFMKRFSEKLNVKNFDDDFNEVLKLDRQYDSGLNVQSEFEEGDFYIESLKINNLFSFPPQDTFIKLDYDDIVGINGKNKSGKTNVVKIIDFCLFNSIPENTTSTKKILNKHNRNKEGYVEMILVKNDVHYKITRTIVPKKSNDNVSLKLEFINLDTGEELHDESRPKTEPIIQKYFGLENMFHILSLFSAQKKQVEFIDCKNAERLKLVNKFLGLQNFEEKEKLVKDDLKIKNASLKEKSFEFSNLISDVELETLRIVNEEKLEETIRSIETFNEELEIVQEKYQKIFSKLEKYKSISDKSIKDIEELEEDILKIEKDSQTIDEQIELIKETINSLNESIDKKKNEITQYEQQKIEIDEETSCEIRKETKKKKGVEAELEALKQDLNEFIDDKIEDWKPDYKSIKEEEDKVAVLQSELKKQHKQLMLVICYNCGRPFTETDKKRVQEQIDKDEKEVISLQNKISKYYENEELKQKKQNTYFNNKKLKETAISSCNDLIRRIDVLISDITNKAKDALSKLDLTISNTHSSINQIKSVIEANNLKIEKTKNKTVENNLKIKEIKEIIEAKELIEEYLEKIKPIKEKSNELKNKIEEKKYDKNELSHEILSIDKQIKEYKLKKEELEKIEEKQRLLSIYRNLVNKDGLPLYILKTKIDAINTEINIIVNQIFDFDIVFTVNEDDGELSLEFVYDEDIEKNDISLASGAETFVINLCIKVGLTQISFLPKLQSLIVDEGFGTLDKQNIEKIPELFESLMSYYKNIILISHLDEMKDLYKYSLNLSKEEKYTQIA